MSEPSAPPPSEAPSRRARIAEARGRAEILRRDATERFELERGRRRSVRAAVHFYERDRRFAGGLLAGGLAFRIFLWLLPLSLVAATLMGYLARASSSSPEELARSSGMSSAVVASVSQAVDNTSHGQAFLLLAGLVLTLWLGRSLVRALKVVCHLAWGMQGSTRSSILASAVMTGYALLFLSVPWLAKVLYAGGFLTDLLAGIGMILTFSALAFGAFWLLPRPADVPWVRLLPGSLAVGVGLEATRLFTSVYLAAKLERSAGLYGSLGVAVVFLAWLYLVGRVFVAAVNLNATLWEASRLEAESATSEPS